MDRFALDVRATLRALRRSPGTTIIAVAALAMGIGFTTTMFSIVHGATRSLPFDQPDELAIVTTTMPGIGVDDGGAWAFDFAAWSESQRSFEELAAFMTTATNLSRDGASPERHNGAMMTSGALRLLGTLPERGRILEPSDDAPGAPAVAIIGHDLWQRRYEADPDIIGRTIRTDGEERVVVGVMPAGFGFPINAEVWMPLELPAAAAPGQGWNVKVFGRLNEGVGLERATAEMTAIAARIGRDQPATHADRGVRVYPFAEMEFPPEMAMVLYLMVGAVSLALLVACANVANLLLARAAARTREVAIRTAIGASRRRIVGMHLVESLVLAVAGGAAGLLFARIAVRFFALSTSAIIEAFWMRFTVDGTVVLFATMLATVAAVIAGIAPGMRASAADPSEALRDQSGGSTGLRIGRLSRVLVVVQVAFATGLLILTAMFVRSAVGLRATPFPFSTTAILTAEFGLTPAQQSDPAARARTIRDLDERLGAIPGISAVAVVSSLPGRGSGNWSFDLDGRAGDDPRARPYTSVSFVTPGFLDVLGAQMDRGRPFGWRDDADAPGVALVNRSWVARFSADVEPLGRRLTVAGRDFEVIGITPDLQVQDVEDAAGDGVYLPMLQNPYATNVRMMSATPGDPLSFAAAARNAVIAVDPDLPFYEVATLHDAIFADKKVLDAFGTLFFLFGLGALFMTVVGLYGVVSFAVNRRTREIGIRVALGAARRDVVAMVVTQGSRQLGIGLAIGLFIAFGVSKVMSAAVEPLHPAGFATFTAVAATLSLTALVALVLPARRALRVQPVEALRQD